MKKADSIFLNIDPVFAYLQPYLHGLEHPTIVEIGAHHGTSSNWLKLCCRTPPRYFAYECDPRNIAVLRAAGHLVSDLAIGAHTGVVKLYASSGQTPGHVGREHTDSSSIKRPTRHLDVHPWCKFEDEYQVVQTTLDLALQSAGMPERIDLIWCDVQGAQREVLAGARKALERTRALYIEVHPEPYYEGEPTFDELCALLGPSFEVVERYPADVLFARPSYMAGGVP